MKYHNLKTRRKISSFVVEGGRYLSLRVVGSTC